MFVLIKSHNHQLPVGREWVYAVGVKARSGPRKAYLLITPRTHARSGVKQWVLSVSVSVSHQNLGLITTTKGLNTSKRHSNNDNSEKTVHGVPEGG